MHSDFALLCFVVVIHWLIFPYPPGLLHWHCGNLTIAPVPAKQPWWIWINTSCEFIMNDCITTKQSTRKPCAYFLGYTIPTIKYCMTVTWAINSTHRTHGMVYISKRPPKPQRKTPARRVVRGGRSLAGIRRRIPTPDASKWSPDSHNPTSGYFPFIPYFFYFFEEEEVHFLGQHFYYVIRHAVPRGRGSTWYTLKYGIME